MKKEIEITFDTEGNSTMEAKGYSGRGCLKATKDFENALGQAWKCKLKPEYYQASKVAKQQRVSSK